MPASRLLFIPSWLCQQNCNPLTVATSAGNPRSSARRGGEPRREPSGPGPARAAGGGAAAWMEPVATSTRAPAVFARCLVLCDEFKGQRQLFQEPLPDDGGPPVRLGHHARWWVRTWPLRSLLPLVGSASRARGKSHREGAHSALCPLPPRPCRPAGLPGCSRQPHAQRSLCGRRCAGGPALAGRRRRPPAGAWCHHQSLLWPR